MLFAVAALALLAPEASSAKAPDDPIVCRREGSFDTGSHLRSQRVCKHKSEWVFEEQNTARELQQLRDKWKDPTPSAPSQPIPQ